MSLPKKYSNKSGKMQVHRLVALAFYGEPVGDRDIVNHIDGNPRNNWYWNLEWCTYSENNFHAINTGLRSDNRPLVIRNYKTGQCIIFASQRQAADFLDIKDPHVTSIFPKMFGKLIGASKEWEARILGDTSPWFYENRTERIVPARYEFSIIDSDTVVEIYGIRDLIKEYKLWNTNNDVQSLMDKFKSMYPELTIEVRDSYEWDYPVKEFKSSKRQVTARCGEDVMIFDSFRKVAKFFNVDRSVIKLKLVNGKPLHGWFFTEN